MRVSMHIHTSSCTCTACAVQGGWGNKMADSLKHSLPCGAIRVTILSHPNVKCHACCWNCIQNCLPPPGWRILPANRKTVDCLAKLKQWSSKKTAIKHQTVNHHSRPTYHTSSTYVSVGCISLGCMTDWYCLGWPQMGKMALKSSPHS